MPAERRALHDDEDGALQMLDQSFRPDLGDDLVSVARPLPAGVPQREREGGGEVAGIGGLLAANDRPIC